MHKYATDNLRSHANKIMDRLHSKAVNGTYFPEKNKK